ncbi:MAG: DUF4291 family protein [Pseudomonadota bacterium]
MAEREARAWVRSSAGSAADAEEIAVYQAYNNAIGQAAIDAQTLAVPGFGRKRMTWIKPSYLWMAYRCGWSTKPNQTTTLRIWLRAGAFAGLCQQAVASHFDRERYADRAAWDRAVETSHVRFQWDPERDAALQAIPGRRALQLGVRDEALQAYLEGITAIEDVSKEMRAFAAASLVRRGPALFQITAREKPLRLPDLAKRALGIEDEKAAEV